MPIEINTYLHNECSRRRECCIEVMINQHSEISIKQKQTQPTKSDLNTRLQLKNTLSNDFFSNFYMFHTPKFHNVGIVMLNS